ncbi:MAG TPA: AbrB/MazE/SpoVT family DNA-binding domain-containing protein [Terriglobia bacterium]|jgi:AbrB family looped-hinge helix DNA binding protein|nr:AbrB/MazE/SpoVT family DNA-binding domain-containing protein [Terriglobia bacterium]
MTEAKLSSKNQIVVPREAREALKLKAGDKLLMVVRGDVLLMTRKPRSFAKRIEGVARGLYPLDYLVRERKSWE